MRVFYFILVLLAGQIASAQSIVVSGSRNSIIVSGKSSSVSTEAKKSVDAPAVPTVKPDPLPYTDAELRRYLGHSVEPELPVAPQHQIEDFDHFIYFYQNHCSGCLAVDRAGTLDQLRSLGIPLLVVNLSEEGNQKWVDGFKDSPPVETVPQFRFIQGKTGDLKKIWSGVFSADSLSKEFRALSSNKQTLQLTPQPTPQFQRPRLPVVETKWGTVDLETYDQTYPLGCNCPMCVSCRQQIRNLLASPQYQPAAMTAPKGTFLDFGQEPTPDLVLEKAVDRLPLAVRDVLADLGCGDGRVLIAAAKRYGCRGIGVEIDPVKAQEARDLIEEEGLSSRIKILTGDVLDFNPREWGVTATYVFLYPDLLEKMKSQFETSKIVVSPFHRVPGLSMVKDGDIWVSSAR